MILRDSEAFPSLNSLDMTIMDFDSKKESDFSSNIIDRGNHKE